MDQITNDKIELRTPADSSLKVLKDNLDVSVPKQSTSNEVLNQRMNTANAYIPDLSISTVEGQELIKEYKVKAGDSLWKIARSLVKDQQGEQSPKAVSDMVNMILEANNERYPQLQKHPHLLRSPMGLLIPQREGEPNANRTEAESKVEHQSAPSGHSHLHKLNSHDENTGTKSESSVTASAKHLMSKNYRANHGNTVDGAHISSEQHTIASWYGAWFNGRKTSSGERYDTNKLTAAHKSLPFGTMVEVTNPVNGHSVVVKINDRGPFVEGRGLDLTPAAARKLGTYSSGIADVKYKVISYKS